jgi:hypothetical protein
VNLKGSYGFNSFCILDIPSFRLKACTHINSYNSNTSIDLDLDVTHCKFRQLATTIAGVGSCPVEHHQLSVSTGLQPRILNNIIESQHHYNG